MYDVMIKEAKVKDIKRNTEVPGLDIAPTNMDLQCEYCSLRGMSQLIEVTDMADEVLNNRPKRHILLTMYIRTNIGNQVVNAIREHYGDMIYKTVILRNIKIAEAPAHGKPVNIYEPIAAGSLAYMALAEEVLNDGR